MVDNSRASGESSGRDRLGGHVRAHAKGLLVVVAGSAVGALAALLFQLMTARALGPAGFGLLSAFFTIINVAAIGSSSLQNSVAVATASDLSLPGASRSKHAWPVEAAIVGLAGGALVAAMSPLLAHVLDTTPAMVAIAAISVPLSFLLADSVGLIQGTGNAAAAVWWSTTAMLVRVMLVLATILAGGGVGGVVAAVVLGMAISAIAAWLSARRVPRPKRSVLSIQGITVMVLTVAFAWLTGADVFFLRSLGTETEAGLYAAVTVLVKASFILPSTLSLYLLPRLVRNRGNLKLERTALLATLGISGATGLLVVATFAALGPWLLSLLYNGQYDDAAPLLIPIALAYVPWIAAFGVLVRMTSLASKTCAVLLVFAAVVQSVGCVVLLPDVAAMIVFLGTLGGFVLVGMLAIDIQAGRRSVSSHRFGARRVETSLNEVGDDDV